MTRDIDGHDQDPDEFADLIAEVKATGDVPEPSPLFWNHLSARVRESVAGEPMPRSWWMQYWRPIVLAGGSAIAVALVVIMRVSVATPRPVGADATVPSTPSVPSAASVADVEVSQMWQLIESAAPNVELSAAQESGLMPTRYATDQAIQSLTPSEREALVRLLRKEMGASE